MPLIDIKAIPPPFCILSLFSYWLGLPVCSLFVQAVGGKHVGCIRMEESWRLEGTENWHEQPNQLS